MNSGRRKVRVSLVFYFVLSVAAFYSIALLIYEAHKTNSMVSPSNQKLILLTYMRSGSTFVGALIGAHPLVFYMYEPLWTLKRAYEGMTMLQYLNGSLKNITGSEKEYWKKSLKTLDAIFSCRFELLDVGTLTHSHLYRSPTTEDYATCINVPNRQELGINEEVKSRIPYCIHLLTSACLKAKVKFVKVIEFNIPHSLALMSSDPLVKVIHLIRDPRAVLSSRKEFGMFPDGHISKHSLKLCRRILADVNASAHNSVERKVLTLRYEDIVTSPFTAANQLYGFVGLDIGPLFLEMIWNMTYAGFPDGCNVCPVRSNATVTANRWRTSLSWATVIRIQLYCRQLMDIMGYRIFNIEKELMNLNAPSTLMKDYSSEWFKITI